MKHKTLIENANWFAAKEYEQRHDKKLLTRGQWKRTAVYSEDNCTLGAQELYRNMCSGSMEATDSIIVFEQIPGVVFSPKLKGRLPVLIEGSKVRKDKRSYIIEGGTRREIEMPLPSEKQFIREMDDHGFPLEVGETGNPEYHGATFEVVPKGIMVVRCGRKEEMGRAKYRMFDVDITASVGNKLDYQNTGFRFYLNAHKMPSGRGVDWDDELRKLVSDSRQPVAGLAVFSAPKPVRRTR